METNWIKLNNKLIRKRIDYIEIQGTWDMSEGIKVQSTEIMKGIVMCEQSQVVTKAFRAHGIETYSCDIKLSSGGNPEWHIQ